MNETTRRRGRGWAYVGALLGGAVSIAANVAHSYVPPSEIAKAITAAAKAGVKPPHWHPQGGAVIGAVFWPVALFVAIEILARVPWPDGKRWVAVRYLGLLPVALVAAVVSYRHLSGLLHFYGEDGLTATIGPLAVDGLMVMATGALIATSHRQATAPALDVAAPLAALPAAVEADDATPDPWEYATPLDGNQADSDTATESATDADRSATVADQEPASLPPADPPRRRTPAAKKTASKPANTTATKVARWSARMPDATHAEIAAKAGVSVRSVERYRPASKPATPAACDWETAEISAVSAGGRPVNGHAVPDLVTTN